MQTIICPNCKTSIEITKALSDQVTEEVRKKEALEFEKKLQEVRIEEKKKFLEENELKTKDARNKEKEMQERIEKLMQNLLAANEEKRNLKKKDEERELEAQKKLEEEIKKEKINIEKNIEEKNKFKILEKDQQLDAMKKTIEELQRKSQQGSQQSQGEVLELELENTLKKSFPTDSIEPVGKGISGSDIRQIVKTPMGNVCGVILWECKRTKAWSDGWITKLKEDMIKETEAAVAVIVSTILPEKAKNGMGLIDRVWVTNFSLTIPLAHLIRNTFLNVARQKKVMENSAKNADLLYEYITSFEFKQQIEYMLEVYQDMQLQIQKERNAFEKSWKIREAQTQKLLKSTASVVGSMQGKIGSSMSEIKGLNL